MIKTVAEDPSALIARVANDFAEFVSLQFEHKKRLQIVLTGGTLGIQSLAAFSKLDLDWNRITFRFGDERFVPLDHSDRNEAQGLRVWPKLAELDFKRFPSTEVELVDAEKSLNQEFDREFGSITSATMAFDLVLLGVGPDGHVASIFPGKKYSEDWIVSEANSPKPPAERLSLGPRALNLSGEVWFMAAGSAKAPVISCALGESCELPVGQVKGMNQTRWYLDRELSDAL